MITAHVDQEAFQKSLRIAEAFFDTQNDPDQIPISEASERALRALHDDSILYYVNDAGDVCGWMIALPTTKELMRKFLDAQITERQLLEMTTPAARAEATRPAETTNPAETTEAPKKYEALYLCAVFVLPTYRRRGYGRALCIEAVRRIAADRPIELFCWPVSDDGRKLAASLASEFHRPVHMRTSVNSHAGNHNHDRDHDILENSQKT